jgi:hypothetical protein
MRHFVLPSAITPGSRRMVASATKTQLVASARFALRLASGPPSAILCAVDVATVAAGADQYLRPTAGAQKKPASCIGLFGVVTQTWTQCATGEILPWHACSRTVWGAALMQLPG